MSTDKQKWESIADDTRDLDVLIGYIKKTQSTFKHLIIPQELTDMVGLFYGSSDSWSAKYNTSFVIANNIIKCAKSGSVSAFMTKVVHSGKHQWRFKMNVSPDSSLLFFGIWCNNVKLKYHHMSALIGGSNTSYVFCVDDATINIHDKDMEWLKYGEIVSKNSIISMCVDFNTLHLSFIINGIDYGESHKIKNIKYRAAISMFNGKYNTIELLSYQHIE